MFDGPDLIEVVLAAEQVTGLTLKGIDLSEAWEKLNDPKEFAVKHFADMLSDAIPASEEMAFCTCIGHFGRLCARLQPLLPQGMELRMQTPLAEIYAKLPQGSEVRRELLEEIKLRGYVDYVDTFTSSLFVFLFAIFPVVLGLGFNMAVSGWLIVLSFELSLLVTTLICVATAPVRPVPISKCRTLADLTAARALKERATDAPWTKSELRLLARHVVADAFGKSILDVRLRSRFHEL